MTTRFQSVPAALALMYSAAVCGAPDPFADVEIRTTPVAGAVHMLTGAGGNVAISLGEDGTLIVDDQFLPLAPRIQAAIDGLGGGRPAFILNTHYHGDHVGGNAFFGETGTIVAHENVRTRLLGGELPETALPVITYANEMAVHFNGEEIALLHLPRGPHRRRQRGLGSSSPTCCTRAISCSTGASPTSTSTAGGTVGGYMANLEAIVAAVPADIRVIPGARGALRCRHRPAQPRNHRRYPADRRRCARPRCVTGRGHRIGVRRGIRRVGLRVHQRGAMDPDRRCGPADEAVRSSVNPLRRLREDRIRARGLNDPYAELCALATVDSGRNPQVRTLVLRDLDDRLAVFVNASSPRVADDGSCGRRRFPGFPRHSVSPGLRDGTGAGGHRERQLAASPGNTEAARLVVRKARSEFPPRGVGSNCWRSWRRHRFRTRLWPRTPPGGSTSCPIGSSGWT